MDFLDQFLEERGRALVILGFQTKFVVDAGMSEWPGRLMERTLFIRSGGQTEAIERKLTRD